MKLLNVVLAFIFALTLLLGCDNPVQPYDPPPFTAWFESLSSTSCCIHWDICEDPAFTEYHIYLSPYSLGLLSYPHEWNLYLQGIIPYVSVNYDNCYNLEEGKEYYAGVLVFNSTGGSTIAFCSGILEDI